jgi:invasion protein IalB
MLRRASKIGLLVGGGSAFLLVSAAVAFLIGHRVGASERFEANRELREREQATLASMSMTKSAFQAWSLVCRGWTGNERRCVLFIAVADPDAEQVLLTLSIARTPQGMPVLVIDAPSGIMTEPGVSLTAGTAAPMRLPIQSCTPERCRAVAPLTPALNAALEAADVTSVSYVRAAGSQPSSYNLPTRGFRDGMRAWYAGSEPTPPAAVVN